jgi:hypothetical protein
MLAYAAENAVAVCKNAVLMAALIDVIKSEGEARVFACVVLFGMA